MSRGDYLFSSHRISDEIQARQEHLRKAVQEISKNRLLNTPTDDLCDELEERYHLDVPTLQEDEIHIAGHGEAQIDVSRDRMRYIRDRSQPFFLTGNFVEFAVPFVGDRDLFKFQASTYSTMPPYGYVQGNELRFRFEQLEQKADSVKGQFNGQLSNVKKYLEWLRKDATSFNNNLRSTIRQQVEQRKERLLKDDEMVASLGFPLKKRDDAPMTYAIPVKRKKPVIRLPATTEQPFSPEPALAQKEYEEILRIISNMVAVIERSPHTFTDMGEEALRQHFLVQLNGQYEGQATGETFNYTGKTDILIRQDDRNVFIAECKFWTGPQGFKETIDQLLGYTSWRDTKTAILLFNRNKNLSAVLEKVPGVVEGHPNYKRTLNYPGETGFRFVLHQEGDPNREITLTVLVFDVPTP